MDTPSKRLISFSPENLPSPQSHGKLALISQNGSEKSGMYDRGHCEISGYRCFGCLEMGHAIPTSQIQYHADYEETDQKRSMFPII